MDEPKWNNFDYWSLAIGVVILVLARVLG